jgi:hypothetical protein
MGIQTPITIAKAIDGIQSNEYILPSIQREFVWPSPKIELLFDSLMRGYPIGSFLFWQIKPEHLTKFQFYRFMDKYHQRDYKHNEPIELIGEKSRFAILDGQQRLTALNIGIKGWYAEKLPYYRWNNDYAYPKKKLYLNLMSEPKGDEDDKAYDLRMLSDQEAQYKDPNYWWFLVGQILQFETEQDVFYHCVDKGLVNQNLKHPSKSLMRLWHVIKKEPVISYFLEEEHNLNKALKIFIRVNSAGTELSYSDMLLSIATAQWKELDAREEIYGLVDDLNNSTSETFNFSKDFVLKASLILSDIKTIEFRVDNFNRENMLLIEQQWNDIVEALMITAKTLAAWGYNRDTLVSHNAAIPLAYYIYKKGNPEGFVLSPVYASDRQKMRRWLSRALLKQTFSGTPDNVLRPVRQTISSNFSEFPETDIYKALSRTAKSMAFDEPQIDALLDSRYGQPNTFTILAMLYPWLKYDQHFHIDHIFPRSMFSKKKLQKLGIPEDQWGILLDHKDDLGNLQLLQGKQNQNKSDKEFEAWLQEIAPQPQELKAYKENHFIPDIDLSLANFPRFLQARTEIIKNKLIDLLQR